MPRLLCVALILLLTPACWRNLMYHPTAMSPADVQELTKIAGWQQTTLQAEVPLVGLIRRPVRAEAPWVLYFAGNAMTLAVSQSVLRQFAAHDWGLAVYAYRGYDGSGGSPTQAGLVADAQAVAQHLSQNEKVPMQRLFIMGQSLGSGVGTLLANDLTGREQGPAGLILISAYTSMAQVFSDHVPLSGYTVSDPWATEAALLGTRCPVLLIHGEKDTVIGVQHSQAKAQLLGSRATLIKVPERGHNDVWLDQAAVRAVETFVEPQAPSGAQNATAGEPAKPRDWRAAPRQIHSPRKSVR